MTAAPRGAAKAAAENSDAIENSKNTDKAVRKTTSKAAAEGEVLPKANPEDVSQPGDETRRPAESDNATETGVERAESDPAKHPTEQKPADAQPDDDEDGDDQPNPDSVPDEFKNPLGVTGDSDGKGDQIKDRNIEDLEKGTPGVSELPVEVAAPNAYVEEGVVEVTRKAKEGEISDPGGNVVERQKTGRQRAPKKDSLKDFDDFTKLPVAAAVGQVTGSVDEYNGRAVLSLSLRGWVGEAPLKILAKDIGELEQVIAELRSQLS